MDHNLGRPRGGGMSSFTWLTARSERQQCFIANTQYGQRALLDKSSPLDVNEDSGDG